MRSCDRNVAITYSVGTEKEFLHLGNWWGRDYFQAFDEEEEKLCICLSSLKAEDSDCPMRSSQYLRKFHWLSNLGGDLGEIITPALEGTIKCSEVWFCGVERDKQKILPEMEPKNAMFLAESAALLLGGQCVGLIHTLSTLTTPYL